MTRNRVDHDPGWTDRLSHAGVRMDLFESMSDDHDWNLLEASVLEVARESTLSDDDLYPLLARLWTGTLPPADWPPRAPSVARRCAASLAYRQACEIDERWGSTTDASKRMVRDAVIDELQLSAGGLLAALAEHWRDVAGLDMPTDGGSSLLAFAEDVLLEPLIGACLQLWLVLRPPLVVRGERTAQTERDGWSQWSTLSGDDWNDVVDAELIRLGHPRRETLTAGEESAWQLADARAADHATHGATAPIAASVVRTSGWPGDPALINALAPRAVDLALSRIGDIDPDSDNDDIINEIKATLTPTDEVLLEWLRDPSFGTLSDGCSATGEEALRDAADWLLWRVCNDAIEFVCAIGRPSNA